MSSEEIEKGKVLRQKETGKVRGNKLGWKRERTGMAREEALQVRSNLLSSKFSPRINQQIQMPDLANVLQLFTVVRDSPATPFVPLVSTGPRSYCRRFKFSELLSQTTKKPSLSSFREAQDCLHCCLQAHFYLKPPLIPPSILIFWCRRVDGDGYTGQGLGFRVPLGKPNTEKREE